MNEPKLKGRLVAATHNKGKLRELRQLLGPHGVNVVSAGELGLPEPEETGTTFIANATIKAEAAARASGLPALADDSGLCVADLDNRPGVYSARWAEGRDFALAMERVRQELEASGAPPPWRAHFISALAVIWPDGRHAAFEGRVDGELVFPPRGTAGFGYDPIFLPDGCARTFGEMMAEEKNRIPADGSLALSHRARAFQQLAKVML